MIIIPLPRANSPLLTHTHITNFGIPPTHLFPSFFSFAFIVFILLTETMPVMLVFLLD